jgi:hypothetical protein
MSLEVSARPACRARDTTWIDRIESPPSSKKLSSIPTCPAPSSSAQMPASWASAGLRGATYAFCSTRTSGTGSARTSTLPLRLSGSRSSVTNADGTM